MIEKKPKNETILSQYFINEEVRSLKILVIGYTIFIFCAVIGFIAGKTMGTNLMEDWQFGVMVAANVLSSLYTGFTLYRKKYIFLTKYILFFVMAAVITLGMFWMGSLWIFLGYYLLVIMGSFFNNWKIALFTGIICSAFFLFLIATSTQFSLLEGIIWLVYLVPIIAVTTFANNRNYIFIKDIIKKQQEAEEAKTVLEIRVAARTKELKELSGGLGQQVQERTKELEEKIAEMKRFERLAVGRELKMVELKEKIKKLK